MALTIKHKGFNKWQVRDGETIIAKDLTKAEAQEMAGLPVDPVTEPTAAETGEDGERAPIPFERDGVAVSETERRREYERRLAADLVEQTAPTEDLFRAACVASFDPTTADHIWRQIEPIIKAGGEGLRRESKRNQRAVAA